jgi:hypothetical protein
MTGQEIYEVLVAKGVERIFHANSVKTSVSQLRLGGLASRQLVEHNRLSQTNQYTDFLDRRLGIWNDIFLDTVDIHSQISDRNKYGPVLFEFSVEVLRNLPALSRVLITRSNPSKWQDEASEADCYFLSKFELDRGFRVGNFDHMLVVRTQSGIVPFADFLQRIILDEPKVINGESPEYVTAKTVLLSEAETNGIQVDIVRRNCASCSCIASYAEKNTRIPWFFAP